MKKVMTFGTFDLLHPGHLYYLSEAKKLWDYLITVVARDSTVENIKKKKPRESEAIRLKNVCDCEYVDEALLGSETDHYAVIFEKKPDILCFGYDQRSFNDYRLQEYLQLHHLNPQILILPPFEPEKWKSSKL
mgnify:CR=1 FL=1